MTTHNTLSPYSLYLYLAQQHYICALRWCVQWPLANLWNSNRAVRRVSASLSGVRETDSAVRTLSASAPSTQTFSLESGVPNF
jgi:hypothetical protein